MTALVALRFAEIGSAVSLLVLWIALGSLLVAILRRVRRIQDPPRDL